MGWLRHVIVDIAVTVIVLIAVSTGENWAFWVIWIYTPFLLLLKIGALTGGVGRSSEGVPDWIYHLLYATNVLALLYAASYWVAGGWVAIWLISAVVGSRQTTVGSKTKSKGKKTGG